MQQYQYLTLKVQSTGWLSRNIEADEVNEHLNKYGREGWELVSAVGVENSSERGTKEIVLFLKRPMS